MQTTGVGLVYDGVCRLSACHLSRNAFHSGISQRSGCFLTIKVPGERLSVTSYIRLGGLRTTQTSKTSPRVFLQSPCSKTSNMTRAGPRVMSLHCRNAALVCHRVRNLCRGTEQHETSMAKCQAPILYDIVTLHRPAVQEIIDRFGSSSIVRIVQNQTTGQHNAPCIGIVLLLCYTACSLACGASTQFGLQWKPCHDRVKTPAA